MLRVWALCLAHFPLFLAWAAVEFVETDHVCEASFDTVSFMQVTRQVRHGLERDLLGESHEETQLPSSGEQVGILVDYQTIATTTALATTAPQTTAPIVTTASVTPSTSLTAKIEIIINGGQTTTTTSLVSSPQMKIEIIIASSSKNTTTTPLPDQKARSAENQKAVQAQSAEKARQRQVVAVAKVESQRWLEGVEKQDNPVQQKKAQENATTIVAKAVAAATPAPLPAPAPPPAPPDQTTNPPAPPPYLSIDSIDDNGTLTTTTSLQPQVMLTPVKKQTAAELNATNTERLQAAKDCELSAWSDWSSCGNIAGDIMSAEQQRRTRKTVTPAAPGGKPCLGSLSEQQVCHEKVATTNVKP